MNSPGFIRSHHSTFNLFQRLADGLVLGSVLLSLVYLFDVHWRFEYSAAVLISPLLFIALGDVNGLYASRRGASLLAEVSRVGYTWFWVLLALLFLAYATKTSELFSRRVMLTWFVTAPLAVASWRMLVRLALREARKMGRNTRRVAIAGAGEIGRWLAASIEDNPQMGMRVIGYYDNDVARATQLDPESPLDVRGGLDELIEAARTGKVDVVYIAMSMRQEHAIQDLLDRLADTATAVYLAPDLFVFNLMQARWLDVAGQPVVSVFDTPFQGLGGVVKRIEDVVLSVLILGIVALPMLAIGILVKITSPGSMLFRQRRYGLGGEEIWVWKFRTMTVCEDDDEVPQAKRCDPRVTKIGAFLRRTSLDELPQFLNVLQGRMSIVGPRPHAVAHNEAYRKIIPKYMVRHIVKPGITGLAQINGWRGETDTIEKMQRRVDYDLEYIRNWSLGLDLMIIARTVRDGFTNKNAY